MRSKEQMHDERHQTDLNQKELNYHLVNLLSFRDVKTLLIVKCERLGSGTPNNDNLHGTASALRQAAINEAAKFADN